MGNGLTTLAYCFQYGCEAQACVLFWRKSSARRYGQDHMERRLFEGQMDLIILCATTAVVEYIIFLFFTSPASLQT